MKKICPVCNKRYFDEYIDEDSGNSIYVHSYKRAAKKELHSLIDRYCELKKSNKMKIYQILLHDKVAKKTTKVEDFPTMSMTALRKRLLELQKGYCKGDEVPVVKERKVQDDGFLVNVLIAESDCDFCYVSQI